MSSLDGGGAMSEPAARWSRVKTWLISRDLANNKKKRTQTDEESATTAQSAASPPPPLQRRRPFTWSRLHSHFVLMGGFAFDTGSDTSSPLPPRLTLTPRAVCFLAQQRPDLIPDVPEDVIRDKSKANHIAKTLVFLQAFWFCLQVTFRLAAGLPISILELNTFAHVFFAFCVFLAWWDKPLDINEPLLISLDRADAAAIYAAMFMLSTMGFMQKSVCGKWTCILELTAETRYNETPEDMRATRSAATLSVPSASNVLIGEDLSDSGEADVLSEQADAVLRHPTDHRYLEPETPSAESACKPRSSAKPAGVETGSITSADCSPPGDGIVGVGGDQDSGSDLAGTGKPTEDDTGIPAEGITLKPAQDSHGVRFCYVSKKPDSGYFPRYDNDEVKSPDDICVTLSRQAIQCCSLARQGVEKYPALNQLPYKEDPIAKSAGFPARILEDFVLVRAPNWPRHKNIGDKASGGDVFIVFLGFLLSGALYGSIHMFAWNGPFHTEVELLLWRIASLALMGTTATVIVAVILGIFVTGILEFLDEALGGPKYPFVLELVGALFVYFLFIPVTAGLVLYLLARIYLVVEGFVNLPYVPEGVYLQPSWAQYFPHIS